MFSSARSNTTPISSASGWPNPFPSITQREEAHVAPTAREQLRFLERRRAQELGYELPLNLSKRLPRTSTSNRKPSPRRHARERFPHILFPARGASPGSSTHPDWTPGCATD